MIYRFMIAVAALTAAELVFSQSDQPARKHANTLDTSQIQFLRNYIEKSKFGVDISTHVTVAKISGTNFSVAFLKGNTWCGSGGCTLLILKSVGSTYEVAGKVTTVNAPILWLGTHDGGYPKIGVWVQGGGIRKGYEATLEYEQGKYLESPSMSRKRAQIGEGTILIGQDYQGSALFEKGGGTNN